MLSQKNAEEISYTIIKEDNIWELIKHLRRAYSVCIYTHIYNLTVIYIESRQARINSVSSLVGAT